MSLFSTLFGKKNRPARSATRHPIRLGFERLDDRLVPSTVAAAPNGTVWAVDTNQDLWMIPNQSGARHVHMWSNVSAVSAGANGFIDVLQTDGTLWQWGNLSGSYKWSTIPHGSGEIGTIAAGLNGEVYITYGSNQYLWEHDNSGWHPLSDWNLSDISVGGNGQLYKVYNNGSFYSADGNNDSWSNNLILSSGVHHVAGASGWNFYITYGSNDQMWNWTQNYGWTPGAYHIGQITADMNGNHDYITEDTYLVMAGWYQPDEYGFLPY